jgi:predicted unusual protein kinase regulating ubiquinone biosynthesis (AarF/ABC1/UbiB family)
MKTIDYIPTNKLQRASQLVRTGVKVGGNYAKYYGKKAFNGELTREELDSENAEDIYDGLKSLKGSALKVAQMLSMEKNILPKAYVEKFSLSQFSVPPLSAPLVRKTFKKYLDKYPEEIFDTFTTQSVNAASIGQVHKATLDGKNLAVKIQYPGVADSISSDLALVKPIASRMFNLKGKDNGGTENWDNENFSTYAFGNMFFSILNICATLSALPFKLFKPSYISSAFSESNSSRVNSPLNAFFP